MNRRLIISIITIQNTFQVKECVYAFACVVLWLNYENCSMERRSEAVRNFFVQKIQKKSLLTLRQIFNCTGFIYHFWALRDVYSWCWYVSVLRHWCNPLSRNFVITKTKHDGRTIPTLILNIWEKSLTLIHLMLLNYFPAVLYFHLIQQHVQVQYSLLLLSYSNKRHS